MQALVSCHINQGGYFDKIISTESMNQMSFTEDLTPESAALAAGITTIYTLGKLNNKPSK